MWSPEIVFQNIIESKMLPNYGKDERKFSFWYNSHTEKMLFMETLKVTFTCNFDFAYFPFDSHHCDFDFGVFGLSKRRVRFAPIKVLTHEGGISEPEILENLKVQNNHLPYSFTITGKDYFTIPRYTYHQSNIGITINIKREKMDQLITGFYFPMTMFPFLSTISFLINENVVSKFI